MAPPSVFFSNDIAATIQDRISTFSSRASIGRMIRHSPNRELFRDWIRSSLTLQHGSIEQTIMLGRERHNVLSQISRFQIPPQEAVQTKAQAGEEPTSQISIIEPPEYYAEVKPVRESSSAPSIISESNSSKDSRNAVQERELKRRKRQRRRQVENQEACMLRGVYFKNLKWQAAIKVDKKQIHLGTVASMEEAAHLYDRAAYMCGREPNFELSKEEKLELQGIQWEDFLALTRNAIANKKRQKRMDTRIKRKQFEASSPSL